MSNGMAHRCAGSGWEPRSGRRLCAWVLSAKLGCIAGRIRLQRRRPTLNAVAHDEVPRKTNYPEHRNSDEKDNRTVGNSRPVPGEFQLRRVDRSPKGSAKDHEPNQIEADKGRHERCDHNQSDREAYRG
jgi:hypothetical protein